MNSNPCAICGSIKFVDDHHLDCREGKLSPETAPLCRRCHRTYHDWGVGAFSPGTTERALEVENMRRRIYGRPLMTLADVKRSGYWRKKWGLPTLKRITREEQSKVASPQLSLF